MRPLAAMWPLLLYVVLLLALFVRFEDPERRRRPMHLEATSEDVVWVRRQHRVFYALLLAAPLEWWWRGRPAASTQLAGVALFLAGVVGYRVAGGALGDQLSPLIAPRVPEQLVDHGPYRRLRHPMYLAELAMALGAPLALGARATLILAAAFASIIVRRIGLEERLLRERVPGYTAYAARTYRLIPYVY
jgi:protein-S-isoprenylcysteine O-methyltransferase Ste14